MKDQNSATEVYEFSKNLVRFIKESKQKYSDDVMRECFFHAYLGACKRSGLPYSEFKKMTKDLIDSMESE